MEACHQVAQRALAENPIEAVDTTTSSMRCKSVNRRMPNIPKGVSTRAMLKKSSSAGDLSLISS